MGARSKNKAIRRIMVEQKCSMREAAEMYEGAQSSAQFIRPKARKELRPLNESQLYYMDSIGANQLTFGVGPAGTGKTFIAASMACDALLAGEVERIVITRPAMEAGESLGFLPGTMDEKFEPYFAPVRDVIVKRLGKSHFEGMMRAGHIVVSPLAYMRGQSFEKSFILLDEAQNTTPKQMKLFLTRIGEDTKVVIDGDPRQCDFDGENGLDDALYRLERHPQVGVVKFDFDDIVRSGLCKDIVLAYEDALT